LVAAAIVLCLRCAVAHYGELPAAGGMEREGSLAIREDVAEIAEAADPERSQPVASSELEPA
jgi:hypothetical protein